MNIYKKFPFILAAFIIILLYLISTSLVQLSGLPEILRLSPGQELVLSVRYPLSFYNPRQNSGLAADGKGSKILTSQLILSSKEHERFNIQLRLFGAIPLKKVRVEVADPPQIIPGGQAVGVLFSSKGVVIVGHIPLRGFDHKQYYPAREAGLKTGDILLKINGVPINRVEDVEKFMKSYRPNGKTLNLVVDRNGRIITLKIKPVLCRGLEGDNELRYRLGIFIEDPAAGVGTLTFISPSSRRFAGLGHRISHFAGKRDIPFQKGEIVLANISGIRKGKPGQPGEKIGIFSVNQNPIGIIEKNCRFGIYGTLNKNFPLELKTIPIAYSSQIHLGPAEIHTVIRGQTIQKFRVEIIKIYRQDLPRDKGIILKVVDPILLRETGGIIQGMSGSPIIQDQKLVGAVTHVFVNDPTKGYGVLAEWMIKEINYQKIDGKTKAS